MKERELRNWISCEKLSDFEGRSFHDKTCVENSKFEFSGIFSLLGPGNTLVVLNF